MTRARVVAALAIGVALGTASPRATPLAAQSKAAADRAEPLPLDRLRDAGHAYTTYSGLADSARLVVRDSVSWRRLWSAINRPFVPPPPMPAIDFDREMVVVAALGARPTSGYDVVIERAERDSAGVAVAVRRTRPGAGCPVLAAVTQPVDLARLPSVSADTRFLERTVVIPCTGPR
jgi:hypothetical protein